MYVNRVICCVGAVCVLVSVTGYGVHFYDSAAASQYSAQVCCLCCVLNRFARCSSAACRWTPNPGSCISSFRHTRWVVPSPVDTDSLFLFIVAVGESATHLATLVSIQKAAAAVINLFVSSAIVAADGLAGDPVLIYKYEIKK